MNATERGLLDIFGPLQIPFQLPQVIFKLFCMPDIGFPMERWVDASNSVWKSGGVGNDGEAASGCVSCRSRKRMRRETVFSLQLTETLVITGKMGPVSVNKNCGCCEDSRP